MGLFDRLLHWGKVTPKKINVLAERDTGELELKQLLTRLDPQKLASEYRPLKADCVKLDLYFKNADTYLSVLRQTIEYVQQNRDVTPRQETPVGIISLDNWLLDSKKRIITPEYFRNTLEELWQQLTTELDAAELRKINSRDYYRLRTTLLLQDALVVLQGLIKVI